MVRVFVASSVMVVIGLAFALSSTDGEATPSDIATPTASASSDAEMVNTDVELSPDVQADYACDSETAPEQGASVEVAALGGSCGGNICRKGTYCCNASCGRCVPFGMSCTQESCN